MSGVLKTVSNLSVLIGAYSLSRVSYDLASGYLKYYHHPSKNLKSIYGPGSILITGSSEGLGLAYATEFAAQGHDLILLARNPKNLQEKKELLEKTYNVKVETIVFDLSNSDLMKYEELKEKLKGLDVAMLVNNAAYYNEKNLSKLGFREINDLIICNCLSGLLLSKILHGSFKNKAEKSAVINIGSQYADRRLASTSNVYFSSKAFVNTVSRSINSQFFKPKIDTVTILPGLIRTSMFKKFYTEKEGFLDGLLIEEPRYLAKQTVRRLGYGENEIYGSQRQAFMNYLLKYVIGRFYEI